MSYKITTIEGIGPSFADKLRGANIITTDDLLEQCGSSRGRRAVSKTTDISEKQLLTFTNKADLLRLPGVGEEYSDLLHAAGIDTVKELRGRRADNLAKKMAEVNEAKELTRTVPGENTVAKWIDAAKVLDVVITH